MLLPIAMRAATVAGIGQVVVVAGAWTQFPSDAFQDVILRGSFDIAYAAAPGSVYFHIDRDMGAITIPVIANANTLYIRGPGGPVNFIYWSP
jgi:hypothetical protein